MRHRDPSFGPTVSDRAGVAAALGLEETDLCQQARICTGTTGSVFLYVVLRDRSAVDRAVLDVAAMRRAFGQSPLPGVFVFAAERPAGAYSRMFAPHTSGIPEDPATGSASGPLGAYLIQHDLLAPGDPVQIVNEQGVRMGPSSVHIRCERAQAP